jgi:hypothetical protein
MHLAHVWSPPQLRCVIASPLPTIAGKPPLAGERLYAPPLSRRLFGGGGQIDHKGGMQ